MLQSMGLSELSTPDMIVLVMFTASRGKMGAMVAPRWLTATAAVTALLIIALNVKLLADTLIG